MKRHYGLDLLRILAMALIVLRHGVYQSGVTKAAAETLNINYLLGVAVNDFTAIAVNCFVIITGFFLSRQEFRPKRLVSLWGTVLFYSLVVTTTWALLAAFSPTVLNSELAHAPTIWDWVRSCFPITSYAYWFISLYFILVMVSPLLNAAVHSVSLRDGAFALSAMIVCLCILPSFGVDFIGVAKGYSLYWFVLLYLSGAFLQRLEKTPSLIKNATGYLVTLGLSLGYLLLKKSLKNHGIDLTPPDDYNFILTYTASIFAFRAFQALEITNRHCQRAIEFLAPLMLGVYLIHDHILKHVIWHSWLGIDAFRNSHTWILQVLLRIALVFAAGCAMEHIRRSICHKLHK